MRLLIFVVIVLAVIVAIAIPMLVVSMGDKRSGRPPTPHEVYAQIITEADKYWSDQPDRALRMYNAADKMLERLGEPKPARRSPDDPDPDPAGPR